MKKFFIKWIGFILIWFGVYINRPYNSLPIFSLDWWIVCVLIIIGTVLIEVSQNLK